MIVYISIGNSDDKLSQRQWSGFVGTVQLALEQTVDLGRVSVHGSWRSPSDAPWQNACWCVEFPPDQTAVQPLRELLAELAATWQQDSIAWAEVHTTDFIGPRRPS